MHLHALMRPREHLAGQAAAAQVQRERWVRAWDNSVQGRLMRYEEGHAFVTRWRSAGSLPAEHTTLVLIEPTVPHDKLIGHMAGKVECLKVIIKELGDPAPEQDEPAASGAPDENASPTSADAEIIEGSLALRLREAARECGRLREKVQTDPYASVVHAHEQYDGEIMRLKQGVVRLLERHGEHELAHEFMAVIPPAWSILGIHGNNQDRLKREIQVYTERLDGMADRLVARDAPKPPVDRLELARDAYRAGHKLLPRMTWGEGAPTSVEESVEGIRRIRDMAAKWSCDVWVMLGEQFPGQEAKFAPEVDPSFGRSGCHMAACEAMRDGPTPHSYVKAKLDFLAELIEREEARR